MENNFKIFTLGCKVNAYESEAIALLLENQGYRRKISNLPAQVCIINTCSVTSRSDAKSRQKIRHIVKENPNCIMVVMGCYSQINYLQASQLEGVSIVIGTDKRAKIPDHIREFKKNRKQIIDVENSSNYSKFENMNVFQYLDNTRAYVKIQDGCNNFCSFCIIPYTRGRVRSRTKEDVIFEIDSLVKNGFKEIILSGIHTGGYGLDFKDYEFKNLLKDIIKEVPTLPRLRISSIEIHEINDEILSLMKNNKIFVDHLHVPIQSGSQNVLKRMNRKYDKAYFLERIIKIRDTIPSISLTTDVIVGFPGESEIEFEETIQTIIQADFSKLHVFPYSNRSGTVASKMPNQIDSQVKKIRVHKLLELSDQLGHQYALKFINQEVEVLFETFDDKTGYLKGHSSNYLLVAAKGRKDDLDKIISVSLKGFIENEKEITLEGEIVNEL